MSSEFSFEFCTLFDRAFLSRGIALIRSLDRHFPRYRIHVLCLDETTHSILSKLGNPRVVPIPLSRLESSRSELMAAKAGRTRQEYCWTLTAPWLQFCLEQLKLDHCTYLDADIWFVDPDIHKLEAELRECSVYITPHHYAPQYDQSARSGIYCVQFVYFRNDQEGLQILRRWAVQCLEWCFARQEDGKFGDQKYLDEWPSLSPRVRICKDIGMGVAPWNAVRFESERRESSAKIAFYHFHGLRVADPIALLSKRYFIPPRIVEAVYRNYLGELKLIFREVLGLRTMPAESFGFSLKERVRRLIFPKDYPTLLLSAEGSHDRAV